MQFYEQTFKRYQDFTDDPKKKNYFDIAASLLLLIVLVVMIYPAIQHIAKVNKEIQDGKVVDEALQNKITNLELAADNLNEIKPDLPLLEKALPTGSDIKTYLKTPLEKLAQNHQLVINSVQFNDIPISTPKKDGNLTVRDITFMVTLTGNFVNITNFIKDLELYIRVTSIQQLDIKEKGNEESIILQATTKYLGTPLTIIPSKSEGGSKQ